MGHIDDNLGENEKIIYRTGLHWVILLGPALLLFLAGISIPSKGMSAMILFIIAAIWSILSYIILQNTEFGITNNRLLIWTIFPRKKLHDIAFVEIADVSIYQPSLGKLLNFGKLTIIFAKRKRVSRRLVNAPYEFLTNLQQQVDAVRSKQQEPPQNNP
jgi:uncharacterized membrane protein YdbT with pleckstrin-like domain